MRRLGLKGLRLYDCGLGYRILCQTVRLRTMPGTYKNESTEAVEKDLNSMCSHIYRTNTCEKTAEPIPR